jgi:hypothetical protein
MENTHKVVARFDQTDEAREAMLDLEVKGIDADAIHIARPAMRVAPADSVRQTDVDMVHRIEARTVIGGAMGALVGAVLVVAALLVIRVDSLGTALLAGGVAGGAGGAFIGAFWGALARLPANEEALDPMVVDDDFASEIVLEVRLDDPELEPDAVMVLRRHHANHIEREAV